MTVDGLFEVGRCRVERDLDRISSSTDVATIRPQVMDVLVYLADRAGQIVSAEELLDSLWPGKVVSSASVYNCITELRSAFQSLDDGQVYVETVPKRGYRLVAPVVAADAASAPASHYSTRRRLSGKALAAAAVLTLTVLLVTVSLTLDTTDQTGTGAAGEERTIAVLPFANLSDEPDSDYLVDGISAEIINALAGLPELQVIARTSSFFFQGKKSPVTEVAETLGVNFVVEGTVLRKGDRLRISYQLVRASDGIQLWADTLDLTVDDILDVQIEIAKTVARSLSVVIDTRGREALRGLGTQSVTAYEHYLRGLSVYSEWAVGDDDMTARLAREWFDKSIDADPEFAAPYTMRAEMYIRTLDGEIPEYVILSIPHGASDSKQVQERLLSDLANAIDYAQDPGVRFVNQFRQALFSGNFRALPGLTGQIEPEALVKSPVVFDFDRINRVQLLLQRSEWVLATADRLMQVDPLDASAYNYAWGAAIVGGRAEAARAYLKRGIAAVGNGRYFKHNLIMTLIVEHNIEEVLRQVQDPAWERFGYGGTKRAFVLALAEQYDEAFDAISEINATGHKDIFLALALWHAGDKEEAGKMLGDIDGSPGGTMHFIHAYVEFGGRIPFDLRWTPRFAAALAEFGLQADESGFVQNRK